MNIIPPGRIQQLSTYRVSQSAADLLSAALQEHLAELSNAAMCFNNKRLNQLAKAEAVRKGSKVSVLWGEDVGSYLREEELLAQKAVDAYNGAESAALHRYLCSYIDQEVKASDTSARKRKKTPSTASTDLTCAMHRGKNEENFVRRCISGLLSPPGSLPMDDQSPQACSVYNYYTGEGTEPAAEVLRERLPYEVQERLREGVFGCVGAGAPQSPPQAEAQAQAQAQRAPSTPRALAGRLEPMKLRPKERRG
ncbi:hypothetical protein B484DRAFT_455949, partial [Ochromonadaceae sp. CCMP2298]